MSPRHTSARARPSAHATARLFAAALHPRALVALRSRARVAIAAPFAALAVCAIACASASALTISPLPGSVDALPRTQISFLGAPASALHAIRVVGSASGRHAGRLRSYVSAAGASFIPSRPFSAGERVKVSARLRVGTTTRRISTTFSVARPATFPLTVLAVGSFKASDIQRFASEPALRPPVVTVHHAASAEVAPGYLFATPYIGPGQYGPMIFDNSGSLVWFHPVRAGENAGDFQTQSYFGNDVLTWWQGREYLPGFGEGVDVIANANYRTVAIVHGGNGLQLDEHEFLLTPQGTAWVVAYSPVISNLTPAGGPASGIALDGVVQEIDLHTGLVMWEWHSLGHVGVSESYSQVPTPAATNPFDYFHLNSIDIDTHGNLLVGARNTWALYEINAHTGAISWRLGGKRTSFKLGPGVAFAYQHNGLFLPDGTVSLFDDEGAPAVKPPSRGEVIKLDTHAKTATLVSQFIRSPGPLLTNSQGNLQQLSGGRWMVGWGGAPNFTEFNAAGQVIYDAQLPNALPSGEFSYRVYREVWSGQPTAYAPAIAVRTAGGATAVYASWNGATTVAAWQLLAGASADHLAPTGATTPKTGFETTIPAESAAYYAVRALSASGAVLATSKAVAATHK
jgi:hypothetical protein